VSEVPLTTESPEARIQRWLVRDAQVGTVAECEQLRQLLRARDAEIVDLRERLQHLRQRVGQLEAERPRAMRVPTHGVNRSLPRRIYRKARAVAARLLDR
jgi:hypothetical protein